MTQELVFLGVAAFSGLLMALQGCLNSALGKKVGLLEATFVVHLFGLVLVGVLLTVFAFQNWKWDSFKEIPWYVYTGGFLGVGIVYAVAYSIPKVGASSATTAIIVGQVLTALLIDHFGLFGLKHSQFTWINGAGLVLLAAGARLLLLK